MQTCNNEMQCGETPSFLEHWNEKITVCDKLRAMHNVWKVIT